MSTRICPVCHTFQRSPGPCSRCGFRRRKGERLQAYELRLEQCRRAWRYGTPADEPDLNRPEEAETIAPQTDESSVPVSETARQTDPLLAQLKQQKDWGQWDSVVETLLRLVQRETDPERVSKYHYTIGVIRRDELNQPRAAVDAFEAALDVKPRLLEAFEAIDSIYRDLEEWRELERAYRRMLRRLVNYVEEMPVLTSLLWRNLGDIYRNDLGHLQSAVAAYECAIELDPSDQRVRQLLAELTRQIEAA